MKIFISKILLFLLYFFCAAFIIFIISGAIAKNKLSNRGRGVVIDKNNRLDSIKTPKIILLGGSNVCYGINSKLLEDSLKMPVVDMAINANMGMMFYYNQVKHAIKEGDIVVGIPEYGAYTGESVLGDDGIYSLALIDKRNYKYFNLQQWLRLPLFMGDVIKNNVNTAFTLGENKITMGRFEYNKWGDYEGHKNDTSKNINFKNDSTAYLKFVFSNHKIDPTFTELVKKFSKYCESKKVIYLHSYPVYAKNFFDSAVAAKIATTMQPVQFINNPETYLYSFDSLYDTPNHILYNIRNERTLKLLQDIKQAIQQK